MREFDIEAGLGRYRDLVDDWPAMVEACRQPLPVVVWQNPFRDVHRAALAAGLLGDASAGIDRLLELRGYRCKRVSWLPGAWQVLGVDKPGLTLEFQTGLLHVQEEISLAPPLVLGAKAGHRVLDMCAAPGGKTARIAIGMDNRGSLLANDVRPHRLRALRANCERLGVANVVVTPIDGTRFPLSGGPFDRILLDVPCSCEGNLRDTPRSAGRAAGRVLEGRSGLQATLLGRAWKLLRPGGVLVYATCTFAPEENEAVLDFSLGDDAAIESFEIPGLRADPGVTEWNGQSLRPDCANLGRFWPHLNDTGGFTIARVRKLEST